ncbi:MAG TPA: hypothetical protein VJL29_10190 [Thermoguttaceae bacterium]|nr:hypothetical protein [Thermoguttaceae bacterium]
MPITFNCPECGASLTVPDRAAGKNGKCKGCGKVITAPAPSVQVSKVSEAAIQRSTETELDQRKMELLQSQLQGLNRCECCGKRVPRILPRLWGWREFGYMDWLCPRCRTKGWMVSEERSKLLEKQKRDAVEFVNLMSAGNGESGPALSNPVCPKCATEYNRTEVIRLIKEQSGFLSDFSTWTTRFVCVKCGEEIAITGVRGE